MKTIHSLSTAVVAGISSLCLMAVLAGCEKGSDSQSLTVDNTTSNAINVYVDGSSLGKADPASKLESDVAPGQHRLVLNADGDDWQYAKDVDILEGLKTVVQVNAGGNSNTYSVVITTEQ